MAIKVSNQINTLMEMAAAVNSSLDPQQVRTYAIEAAMKVLNAEAGSLLLIDEENNDLFFEIALGDKGNSLKHARLKKGEGIAGWVAENGLPQNVSNARKDPRFCPRFDDITGFVTRNMICVPVKIKGKTIGVLEAINKIEGRFGKNDQEILSVLANHVAIALENALLHQENLARLAEIVAKEKWHIIEKEKLVKELYEDVGGITANISNLSELARKMDGLDEIKKALEIITELSMEGSAEISGFMNCLENREAGWGELVADLRSFGHNMIEPHNRAFALFAHVNIDDEKPGIYLCLTLFKIFKEALANILKHSQAGNVEVILSVNKQGLTLTIRDDGIGLMEGNPLGRGIDRMKARAAEIGGKLLIQSGPGTSVQLEIPFPLNHPG